ncbi:hypothetical protein IMG5_068400 [Ichthyophthirius multifiliis]|uniref:HEAT repeat domain-containing protein n=1 Tax=Ichthyophthirius multifiliis TaxID=5932 RepID=G0QPI4_ICHMU|nr:hypothetical protein IMG5_068400 [Ichthyophthirius multifiliis]EGR32863.1 hypothetical protein IMG5_068400 [Ichthyophthirius multifiliis]|eukprot:XP_004036849.1 hypothetical protein IMG5_068400 [Ichthyophthirius multifiliis]
MQQQLSRSQKQDILNRIKQTEDIDEIIKYTYYEDNDIRLKAVSEMCPCRVKDDNDEFWVRIFQMANDPDPKIRYKVLHIMCDGSPERLENEIIQQLNQFNRDLDKDIKRLAHKVLGSYQKTGKWNIL